jgi:hypothetical protein
VQGEGPVVAAVERGLRHVIPEQARADGMTLGAHTLAILVLPERVDASVRTTDAVFRHFGHFDFGNHAAGWWNAASHGRHASGVWPGTMNDCRRHWRAFICSLLLFSCLHAL